MSTIAADYRLCNSGMRVCTACQAAGAQRNFAGFGPEKLVSTTISLDNNKTYELKGVVRTTDGQEKDTTVRIGVGVEWDYAPSPSPTVMPSPTPSSSPI